MTAPNFLDDPKLARRLGMPPAIPTDATGVAMPDPASIPLQAKLDSLDKAYADARARLTAEVDAVGGGAAGPGKLSGLDILSLGMGGAPDAQTMTRIAGREAPDTKRKLAEAVTRKAKFGKGGK